jgi:hypothetical protein
MTPQVRLAEAGSTCSVQRCAERATWENRMVYRDRTETYWCCAKHQNYFGKPDGVTSNNRQASLFDGLGDL